MQVEAAYRLLSDGQWHTWTELRSAMLSAIPSGPAKRYAIKYRERSRVRNHTAKTRELDEEDLIALGRNILVNGSLNNFKQVVHIDRGDSNEKVNWRVKLKTKSERYPFKQTGMADEEWRDQNPDKVKEILSKVGNTKRENWRNSLEELTDEQALHNETERERAALITRPHLWPSEPAPISALQHVGGSIFHAGWLRYEKGEEETFIIDVVWPVQETLVFKSKDISQMVRRKGRWRILLPKEET